MSMMTEPKTNDDEDAWLRQWVVPEEDRRQYTSTPNSGYRWFRSANVVDLETVRRKKRRQPGSQAKDPQPAA
jgi:hypothetical protein